MKVVIYQVLVRLFGNTCTHNVPYGTKEENGIGKFSDFTDAALEGIKQLGTTHIWLTGVLHHALVGDYIHIGIPNDIPYLVKGRAGSPYAIKDYYNVNPDLADDPTKRLEEFVALVERIHQHGLKVMIDIVPNHVARCYHSISNPKGVEGFGVQDNIQVGYARDNNFYYNIGELLTLPASSIDYIPEEPALRELLLTPYKEYPAKWTGNSRSSSPALTDWYETVKLNYGVAPDGRKDFDSLPPEFARWDTGTHYAFWRSRVVPNTWQKFKEIVSFWLSLGVDGFRYDMAEMVPVEFWSYLNSFIKSIRSDAFLLAEIYNTDNYRDYLHIGKMDALYNKVGLYDTLRDIICYEHSTDRIDWTQDTLSDIWPQMLHFMENHDEQRIVSEGFAHDPRYALPAMAVSAHLNEASVMVYFGQEVGEAARENAGFGSPTRTSIFDYIGVPAHQHWVNGKRYDGGALTPEEVALREYYCRLLNLPIVGAFRNIHQYNRAYTPYYNDKVYSFVRETVQEKWLVIANFSKRDGFGFELQIPPELLSTWDLPDGTYPLTDELYGEVQTHFHRTDSYGRMRVDIAPLQTLFFKLEVKSEK
ncbi:alpha-amylase family glycosyl hydrolase [uncultured Capnocytophaga sp.]|uniref:alpha-amylase family glycosyl hydrolase n=1 Tax=uncultured Capnocytophaga sp. TaxID=159273 RepID=UPI002611C5C0|nr:alpha-amylase family glycosyl hydrolase [uncultured Capnocytophaga sp.]